MDILSTPRPGPAPTILDPRLAAVLAGRYELGREIGRGAMAAVYLAHDVRHARTVAIKILRRDVARTVGAERFLREIRMVARLSHPNVLPLFDSGRAGPEAAGRPDDLLYFIMPYVEGGSVRDRLERAKPLPVDEAVRIAAEVADALDYAHRQGIVHRDVKPENILLHEGHALVADFGIGKAMSEVEVDGCTAGGLAVGTPAYMSPEQAAGDDVDRRSDIYSLGCVLYEMLSGEQPFTGPNSQAVIAKRFVHLPTDVSMLRDGVPRHVARAVRKALARSPADRFGSGAELAAALRQPEATAAILAPEKSVAVLPFINMSTDPENEFFADGITEEILNELAAIPGLRVAGRTSSFAFKGKTPELRSVGEQLGVRAVLEGSVRRAGTRVRITAQLNDVGGYHLWSEKYDREIGDVFALQEEIARAIATRLQATLDSDRATALAERSTDVIEAYEVYLKGRAQFYRRGAGVRDGLALMQRALELDPGYALAWAGVADGFTLLGYYGVLPPEVWAPKAREAAAKALELGPNLAETHNALAQVSMLADWDWDATERGFRRALELNPGYLQAAAWYGLLYKGFIVGRWDDALPILESAQRREPLSAYAAACTALAYAYGGRPADGVQMANRACELDPTSFLSVWSLQNTLYADRQYQRSVEAGDRVLSAFGRHPWALYVQAVCLAEMDDGVGARSIHQELEARAAREFLSPLHRGVTAAMVGEPALATSLLREAIERRDPAVPIFLWWASTLPPVAGLPVAAEVFAGARLPILARGGG